MMPCRIQWLQAVVQGFFKTGIPLIAFDGTKIQSFAGLDDIGLYIFIPKLMAFIYHLAMFVAHGISWVVMPVMLGILFYLVLAPISIMMRLLGKDILDQKVDRNAASYWKKHVQSGRDRYERLF